jgi:LEA14-like dessication related protein
MKINPLFIAAPVALLLLKGGSVIYNASRLNFYIAKLVPRLQGITPVIDIYVGVQNPTGGTFTVQSVAGKVYVNENYLGDLSSFTLTTVKPNQQTFFVATLRMSLIGLASEVYNAITEGLSTVTFNMKFNGTVNVNSVPVPVALGYRII